MSDLLLVAGVVLAVLSVPLAIVALARTEAPRAGAAALVLGLMALVAGAMLAPQPFRVQDLSPAFGRVLSGNVNLAR